MAEIGPGLRREDKEVLPGLSQPSCVIPFLRRHTNVVPRLTPIRGVPWSGASGSVLISRIQFAFTVGFHIS